MSEAVVYQGRDELPLTPEWARLCGLEEGRYRHERLLGGVEHLILDRDSFRPGEPLSSAEQVEHQDRFTREMSEPIVFTDPITGFEQKAVVLNRGGTRKKGLWVNLSFTDSPSAENGRSFLRELSFQIPDRPIVSLYDEGTRGFRELNRRSRGRYPTDESEITEGKVASMYTALELAGEAPEKLSIVGVSKGGVVAFKGVQTIQRYSADFVEDLILISTPVSCGSPGRLCGSMIAQEVPAIIRSSREEQIKFMGHAIRNVLPEFIGLRAISSGQAYRNTIKYTADAMVDTDGLIPGVNVCFATGGDDKTAKLNRFLSNIDLEAGSRYINNILGITFLGKAHTTHLLDAVSSSRVVETALRYHSRD